MMHCTYCGADISSNIKFCPSCGTEQQQEQAHPINHDLIGYSSKISDPKIAAAMKKNSRAGIVFTLILVVVAVIGFTAAGAAEVGGFELPSALYMGLGFGLLLLVIAFIQVMKARNDKTWDGIIFDKKIKQPNYSNRQNGNYQTRFRVHLRLENGKNKIISVTEDLFNYYQINDRVRHHSGTASHILEKYDKSHDDRIYCIVCTSKNDMVNDVCHRCKSPLLK